MSKDLIELCGKVCPPGWLPRERCIMPAGHLEWMDTNEVRVTPVLGKIRRMVKGGTVHKTSSGRVWPLVTRHLDYA